MSVGRITPYLVAEDFDAVREFYGGVIGLEEGEFGGDHVGFAAPENRSAQIVAARAGGDELRADLGVDVGEPGEVDRIHADCAARGLEILYGPVLEPWGVRRFFVRDPTGAVVSVLAHA